MYQKEFGEYVNRLTDNARLSLKHAEDIAKQLGSVYIGTEHLLLGVLSQNDAIATKMLSVSGVTLERAKLALKLTPKSVAISAGQTRALSETAKMTLRLSWDIAQEFDQEFCGTEHILYSILTQKNARATVLLRDMSINVDELVDDLEQFLNRQQNDSDIGESTILASRSKKKPRLLDEFGEDLTEKARAQNLDPVIGREKQLHRMITILGRRTKNNPVLIGEPGVGKSAIVEGLAQRIVSEDVPHNLIDKRVFNLDLASLIAGTKYRGEFEERLRQVVDELIQEKDTIVFIDELHLLVGAGAAEGAIDAANMLKPALARGQMQLIGATTLDEYKKHIEKDAALERRLQNIIIPESTVEETIQILKGVRRYYEKHHQIAIGDEILEDAAYLAKRYIGDRFMPDKAIDLIDEASSLVKIERGKTPSKSLSLKKELKMLTSRMESAVDSENYGRAAKYKTRMGQIEQELEKAEPKNSVKLQLKIDDVSRTVAQMTGIPTRRLMKSEAKQLLRLEKHLSEHLVGQGEAIEAVSRAIRRNKSGIASRSRPIGSFVFMGPTGVGKSELAKVLAREVFGSEESLIKFDMSEFGERHMASRLIGAPAGYVGYEEGGQLTEKIRRNPYSLLLFDEIEKAHPEVFNLLLQVLEDGYLTDAKGRKVDFTNAVIILTSNIGAEHLQKEASLGFTASTENDKSNLEVLHAHNSEKATEELKKIMRPELVNRFDKIVVFKALTRESASKILSLQLSELSLRIGGQGLGLYVSPSAKRILLNKGYSSKSGVRPLRRIIQETIEDEVAEKILNQATSEGDLIKVTSKKNDILINLIKP